MLINVKEAISKSGTLLQGQRQKDYYSRGGGVLLFLVKPLPWLKYIFVGRSQCVIFVLVVLFCGRLQIMTAVSRILQRCYGRPLFEG